MVMCPGNPVGTSVHVGHVDGIVTARVNEPPSAGIGEAKLALASMLVAVHVGPGQVIQGLQLPPGHASGSCLLQATSKSVDRMAMTSMAALGMNFFMTISLLARPFPREADVVVSGG